jgi:hypothetical protein
MDLWGIYITALDVKIDGKNKAKGTRATEDDDAQYTRTISDSSNEELSDDEDDSSTSNMPSEGRAYRSSTQELKKYPPLLISALFSYFGILILKLPITLSDIFTYLLMKLRLTADGLKPNTYHTFARTKLFRFRC